MKKVTFLTIVFLLFSVVLVNAQNKSTLWSEDFEGDWTANWHVDAGTWEVGTPTSGPGEAYNGLKCAATVLAGSYPPNANTRLIRHTSFVIPGADQNPRLRFWHWYSFSSGDAGNVQIKVGAGDWQAISDTYINTCSGIWTYPSIDLSAYAGSTVQLAFYLTSDGNSLVSSGWYVDDIDVITGPVLFNNPETWEMGLGDWYVDKGTWEVGTPSSGPGGAYMGQNCAATVLNGNYHANVSSRLISQSFTIPGADQNPRLRFWHWYSFSSGDAGNVQIKVGEGGWQTISENYINTGSGIWTYPSIDLSAFAGSTVQIAFYLTSDGNSLVSSGWYVDDIAVITGPIVFNTLETWEMGLGDWYVDKGTWEVGTPTSGPGGAYAGQNCATTVLNGNYHANVSSRLISPSFTIPSANQNPSLRFWHWYSFSSGDFGNVQIKTEKNQWQTVLGPFSNTSGGIWSPSFIDLSPYADSTVQIAFYLTSDGNSLVSPGWYVDDIIVEIPTGITENSILNRNINIYPNPFSDKTTIEFDNTDLSNYKLSVFNISGKKVFEMDNIRSDKIELNRSNLPKGVYFIELKGEKVIINRTIIIK